MKLSMIQTIGGGLLALALGAGAAAWRGHSPAVPSSGTSVNATASGLESGKTMGRPIDPVLAEGLRVETGAKRWLLLLAATEEAKPSDMPGLILAAGKDSAAVRMLGARWAEMDPKHMFQSLYAEYLLPTDAPGSLPERWALTDVLLEHWTKLDPAAVRKALNEVPNFSGRDNLRMTVVNHLMKNDVEMGMLAMQEWNIRHYIPDMKKVAEWALKDPARAAETVAKFGQEHAGREALKQVGKAWAQRDPEAGLRFAATLRAEARSALGAELVTQWAERDLTRAAEFVANQKDVSFRSALAQGLATAWGKKDPAAALAWAEENLQGQARTEVIGGLVKAAAEKDITAAAELVAAMEPGAAQNRACASIFEAWFKKGSEHRNAAIEWLAGVGDSSARQAAMERVQWDWFWREPDAVRAFVNGPHGHLASDSIIQQVARAEARKNPEAALEWAKSLGTERAADARFAVFEGWLSSRPEAAGDYVRKMPAGEERTRAIRMVAGNLIWQSTQQAAAWYHSLSSADQEMARQIYDGATLTPDKRKELNEALKK